MVVRIAAPLAAVAVAEVEVVAVAEVVAAVVAVARYWNKVAPVSSTDGLQERMCFELLEQVSEKVPMFLVKVSVRYLSRNLSASTTYLGSGPLGEGQPA